MTHAPEHGTAGSRLGGLLWLAAALLLSLSVLAVNRAPLYYFDSGGYYEQGTSILDFLLPDSEAGGNASGGDGDGGTGKAGDGKRRDTQVSVSRSPIFSLLVATSWQHGPPLPIVGLNLVAVFVAAMLCARAVGRATPGLRPDLTLTAAPVAAAALTSLPFFVAYIMPDTFAPVAILVMAVLVAFARVMRPWEILLAFALLALAVIVHRSHLVIVGLALPLAVVAVFLAPAGRRWIAPGLIALAALGGIAEIKAYGFVAEKATGKNATFTPFLTARLIQDGPGYDYLLEHCPDPGIPTCALAEALSRSDDPYRLTASHIIFERSERLGSFQRMTQDNQVSVAQDQRNFFLSVLADQPFAVMAAALRNTLIQTGMTGVELTVPHESIVNRLRKIVNDPDLDPGRLAADTSWIPTVDAVHTALYGVSLAVISVMILAPGLATREMRLFAAFVLAGILVNAFVCGAVSQPSDRYGARVIWLLPFLATLMTVVAIRRRAAERDGSVP